MSYIQSIIDEGEHQTQDFKFEVSDSKKIARTLSAFANTDGGKLLVGVKDNGKIAGVRSDEEFYMIEGASQLYTCPVVPFKTRQHNIKGKTVLEIDISISNDKPVLAPDLKGKMKAYIRTDDKNRLANGVLIKVWEQEKNTKGVKINYTSPEKFILDYLNINETITFSKFVKSTKISRYRAEKILVDFIILNIIEIVFTKDYIYYKSSVRSH